MRGPSAGGSGQSNVYLFDGANVTMPLFGVLVAEPDTHDIASVNIIKGGANAVDFYRAGGFQIDSVSKSGTNRFSGEVGYQVLNHSFIADQVGTQTPVSQDKNWSTVNIGGPILADHLFFYGSYYRPYLHTRKSVEPVRSSSAIKRTAQRGVRKTDVHADRSWLFNGSWRHAHEDQTACGGVHDENGADRGYRIRELSRSRQPRGSKIMNPKSYFTFKLVDFRNPGGGQPTTSSTA